MDNTEWDFQVLGVGHLAAAVRVQLRHAPLQMYDLSRQGDSCGARTVVLACSDYECSSSFADANRRAVARRSPILFAWLSEEVVRMGPLVVPLETSCFACQHLPRRWDFSLSEAEWGPVFARTRGDVELRLKSLAHFAALLIVRELGRTQFGAGVARLIGCVAKFDPPRLFPELTDWRRAPACAVCGPRHAGIPAKARPQST